MSARHYRILVVVNVLLLVVLTVISEALSNIWYVGVMLVCTLASISVYVLLLNGVKRGLRARGYEWVESFDAVDYARRRGTSTRDVPLHSDMLLIPGYDDVNIESLCECLGGIISELGVSREKADRRG